MKKPKVEPKQKVIRVKNKQDEREYETRMEMERLKAELANERKDKEEFAQQMLKDQERKLKEQQQMAESHERQLLAEKQRVEEELARKDHEA